MLIPAHDGSEKGARAAFDEFKQKTREPWPNMDADLEDCMRIMHKWFLRTGPLSLIEDLHMNGESITYHLPEWQMEISQYFTGKYGEEAGGEIFPKAIYRLIPIPDEEEPHPHHIN